MIDPDKPPSPDAGDPPSLVDEELAREVSRLLEEDGDAPTFRATALP
jgi:hypothetical protein